MCYAGSSSKQLLTTLSSTLENEIFAANISSLTENENCAKILDEEMCELDCRKRAGEKDGSSDLAVQVKIIFLYLINRLIIYGSCLNLFVVEILS